MRIVLTILFVLILTKSVAQDQYIISQYMLNSFALNPAYAGSHQAWSFTLMSRYQLVGVEGAPRTNTFSAHGPIKNNSSAGLLAVMDKYGPIELTNVYGTYSYRIPFDHDTKQLSVGFQTGFTYFNVDLSNKNLIDPDDPVFNDIKTSNYLPNFGFGVYYQGEKVYAGLSVPYFYNNSLNQIGSGISDRRKYCYLTAGGVIELIQSIKYKPSFLIRYVSNTTLDIDLNSSFVFNDVVWLGITYRVNNSFNFILELQITDNFRVGYAYDLIQSDLNKVSSGSNEFVLNYRIRRKNKVFHPRYF